MAGEDEKVRRQDVQGKVVGPSSKRKAFQMRRCTKEGPSHSDFATAEKTELHQEADPLVEAAAEKTELHPEADPAASSEEEEEDDDDDELKYLMPPGLAQIYIAAKYEDPNPPEPDYGYDEELAKRCRAELGPFREEKMDPEFLDRVEREFNEYGYVLVSKKFFDKLEQDRADCQEMMDRVKNLTADW